MEVTGLIQRNIVTTTPHTSWLSEFNDRFSNYEEKEIPMKMSLTLEKFHTN
jgi:hypothetical protein